uniref:NADH dehydrogenase subunit 2 n=1 Tax=Schizodactylus jimo TaxID=2844906 RepID=UPI002237B1E7|nr:NADH dehydrogenase subunit 2 [Schizodactylus jimo]UYR20460.1 NADH dehydrogenase subunit 2 [Schizodactylus jimo]
MYFNPSKILFIMTLVSGTLISISSTSWIGAWMGLEINLLSFIPLMSDTKNSSSTEASLKYFLVQALASATLLFAILMMHLMSDIISYLTKNSMLMIISSTLMLKMGAAPFHFWFPGTMEGLNWINCFILMTWQKIAPIMLTSYTIHTSMFTIMIIISSTIIGSLGGMNQTSMRKLLAYSSINHIGWMLAAMMSGDNLWEIYFLIYSFLNLTLIIMFHTHNISHINQPYLMMNHTTMTKFNLFTVMLSLGGLPPFIGFLPKWLVIESMTKLNFTFTTTIMVIMTLITLFYYLRVALSSFLLNYTEVNWNQLPSPQLGPHPMLTLMSMFSSLGLIICITLFNIM